jgi:hypothetical protein
VTVPAAFLQGWLRALRAPLLVVGLLLLALIAVQIIPGWNLTRADAFLGFGGAWAALDRAREISGLRDILVGIPALHAVLWLLLAGGVVDRLTRDQSAHFAAFAAACRRYFFSLLRIAVFLLPFYAVLWFAVRPRLLEAEAGVGRDVLLVMFFLVLALVQIVGDFAAVRTVAEDRRSAIGAIAASVRFIRRRPGRIALLYVLNVLAMVSITRLWLVTASAAGPASLSVLLWPGYALLRIWARLGLLASEVAFFQGELGEAPRSRPAEPVWPDAPSSDF